MYLYMADIIEEQGESLVERFGKVFQFGILDETDTEVPITIDFKNGQGDIYIGSPKDSEEDNVACKIKFKETDFHKVLDSELGVKKAIL